MREYLMEKYALSEKGAKDILISIVWNFILNISYMLPAILGFYYLNTIIVRVYNESDIEVLGELSFWVYILISIVFVLLMFLIAIKQYDVAYTKTYMESATMRINIAEKLRKLPLAYFGQRDLADLTTTIMNDASELELLYSHALPNIYATYISTTLFTIMLFMFNWKLTLTLMWIVPIVFVLYHFASKKQMSESRAVYTRKLLVSDCLQEGLDCIGEIKAYNYEEKYSNKLNLLLDDYEKTLIKEETFTGVYANSLFALLKLGLVSIAIIGTYLFYIGEVDLFSLIVYLILSSSIYNPIIQLLQDKMLYNYSSVRINRIKEIDKMPEQTGSSDFVPNNYDIEFKNVAFSYDGKTDTIKDISFVAKQNEVTALVGASGGGKSTVSKIAARFWDVNSGVVTLGGVDISSIEPKSLLKYYSIVFQDVTLFNFSILENIRVGNKDATDEEVLRVAKLAECDDFANKLPEGYHTLIGENGDKLSGGERQRVSIARAMLKDSPIVLLDEATASLDAENETKIQRALSELVKNKTVIVIAHRMRTVLNADKIIVLDDGKIAETGSPDELLKQGGIFAKMNRGENE